MGKLRRVRECISKETLEVYTDTHSHTTRQYLSMKNGHGKIDVVCLAKCTYVLRGYSTSAHCSARKLYVLYTSKPQPHITYNVMV